MDSVSSSLNIRGFQTLLEAGADPSIVSPDGKTVMNMIKERWRFDDHPRNRRIQLIRKHMRYKTLDALLAEVVHYTSKRTTATRRQLLPLPIDGGHIVLYKTIVEYACEEWENTM